MQNTKHRGAWTLAMIMFRDAGWLLLLLLLLLRALWLRLRFGFAFFVLRFALSLWRYVLLPLRPTISADRIVVHAFHTVS
jgi:hypothetical protein